MPKIPDLPNASSLDDDDRIPVFSGGTTKSATVSRIRTGVTGGSSSGKTTKAMANANQAMSADEAAKPFWKTTGTGHTAKRKLMIAAPATEAESYQRTFLNACTPSGTDENAGTVTLSTGAGTEIDVEAGAKALLEVTPSGVNVIADLPLDPRDFGCPWNGVDDDLPGLILMQQSIPAYRQRATRVQLPKGEGWCSDNLQIFRRLDMVGCTGKSTVWHADSTINGLRFPPLKGVIVHGDFSAPDVPESGGYGNPNGSMFRGVSVKSQSAIISDSGGNWGLAMSQLDTTYNTWERLTLAGHVKKGAVTLKSTAIPPYALTVGSDTSGEYYGDGHARFTQHLVWFRCITPGTPGSAKPVEMASTSGIGLADIGTVINATGGTAQWVVEAVPKDYVNGATVVLGQRVFLPGDNAHVFECIALNGAATMASGQSTTLHSDMDGLTLPRGTIRVASTTGFPPVGTIRVTTSNGFQWVTYAGKTSDTFTGCNSTTELKVPSGTMSTGGDVSGPYKYASWGVPVVTLNRMFQPEHLAEFYDIETPTTAGGTLPVATISVVSTSGFAASGTLKVWTGSSFTTVSYTGKTDTTFTGCTGGTGTFTTDSYVGQGCLWREIHSALVTCLSSWVTWEDAQLNGGSGAGIWIVPNYKRATGSAHYGVVRGVYFTNLGVGVKITGFDSNGWQTSNCQFDFMGGGRTNVDAPDYLNLIEDVTPPSWADGRFGNAGDAIVDRELGLNLHSNHYTQFSGGEGYRNDVIGAAVPSGNASLFEHCAHELLILPTIRRPATVVNPPQGVSQRSRVAIFSGNVSQEIRTEAPLVSDPTKKIRSNHGPQSLSVATAYEFGNADDVYPFGWHASEDLLFWTPKWWTLGRGENAGWFDQQVLAFPRIEAGATMPGGGSLDGRHIPWVTQDWMLFGNDPSVVPNALGYAASLASILGSAAYFKAGSIRFNKAADGATNTAIGWLCTASGTPGTWTPIHAVSADDVETRTGTLTTSATTANQSIYGLSANLFVTPSSGKKNVYRVNVSFSGGGAAGAASGKVEGTFTILSDGTIARLGIDDASTVKGTGAAGTPTFALNLAANVVTAVVTPSSATSTDWKAIVQIEKLLEVTA